MSTIAEPPPKTEAPDKSAILAGLLRPTIKTDTGAILREGAVKEPKEAAKETPKEEVKAEAKETPKEQAKEQPKDAPKEKPDQEKNWAELRTARETAEKLAKEREDQLAKLTADFETYKKNPIPKEFEEKLTAAEKRAQEAQEQLRAVDLRFDPDIQAMDKTIREGVQELAGYLVQSGIPQEEVTRAINGWDEAQLGEWKDALTPGMKLRFEAAFHGIINTDRELKKKLANPTATYADLEARRKAEAEKIQSEYVGNLKKERAAILAHLASEQDIVKNDPALQEEIGAILDNAARLSPDPAKHMNPGQILRNLANAHVLARHFQRIEGEKKELSEKVAGLEKTLAERDEFIKSLNGSIPTPGTTKGDPGEDKSRLIDNLIRPKVRI